MTIVASITCVVVVCLVIALLVLKSIGIANPKTKSLRDTIGMATFKIDIKIFLILVEIKREKDIFNACTSME